MPSDPSSQRPLSSQLSFADLVLARRNLQELLVGHRDSINFFATERGFARTAEDCGEADGSNTSGAPAITPIPEGKKLSGVTTALTCFESLMEYHASTDSPADDSARLADEARLDAFTKIALERPAEWRSEGAARKYCIVRAAAPLLTMPDRRLAPAEEAVVIELLREAWETVTSEVDTQGLYETAITPAAAACAECPHVKANAPESEGQAASSQPKQYPPNSFLTYWGLRAVTALPEDRFEPDFRVHFEIAYGWLQSTIGRQVALHFEQAPSADPQQLAWAICGVAIAKDKRLAERTGDTLDLVRAGLRAFFEQQRPDGSWDRGQPLFHYPEAGNAYCYQYETLAELVTLALEQDLKAATDLRSLLRPYLPNLLLSMDHAVQTLVALDGRNLIGWNSGHHPHRRSAESWATASIYKYLQALRRLVGLEVSQQAAVELRARKARQDLTTLRDRGDTWDAGDGSAGALLATLFVHPVLEKRLSGSNRIDPDRQIFVDKMARSALLFGPPGTGKTTLVEAVAGALEWDFIEITPAQFLDEGIPMVSARADEVFRQLMELDQCVVLLDEIDELVRDRSKNDSGPTERFFTTTMLPRLAELWKQRRVVFFANTNGIEDVDHAIRRSQRFDAAIFVLPPGLEAKLAMLGDLAGHADRSVITKALEDDDLSGLGKQVHHGWLAFIRYDQVERLVASKPVNLDDYVDKLKALGEEVARTDWHQRPAENDGETGLFQRVRDSFRVDSANRRIDQGASRRVAVVSAPSAKDETFVAREYEPFDTDAAITSAGERLESETETPAPAT